MPTITLSEQTYAKLQDLAEPFVDNPETVIVALADAERERRSISPNRNARRSAWNDALRLNVDAHENLAHTRVLSATVDGQPLHRPKWNGILEHVHILGRERLGSFEELRRASSANLREGCYEENGYKYIRSADFSIQGVDSNLAWDHSLRLARVLRVPIQVTLEWRDKEGAAHPGKEGVLEWYPA